MAFMPDLVVVVYMYYIAVVHVAVLYSNYVNYLEDALIHGGDSVCKNLKCVKNAINMRGAIIEVIYCSKINYYCISVYE